LYGDAVRRTAGDAGETRVRPGTGFRIADGDGAGAELGDGGVEVVDR
jgi:hypothetical protein